jgi:hypothetical protein
LSQKMRSPIMDFNYTICTFLTNSHHAEGLVNPKLLAKKPVTDFRFRKHQISVYF